MKMMKKLTWNEYLIFRICLTAVAVWQLYVFFDFFAPVDLSQDYRKVPGIEKIVFEHNGRGSTYKRCIWGLKKVEAPQINNLDNHHESDASLRILCDLDVTDNEIRQAVYSPDRRYILYCEIDYDYHNSGMTDDEYCYYRVYDIKNSNITTIYEGYREWYNLYWMG